MIKMGVPHGRIQVAMELSGLTCLVGTSYDTTNKGLMFVFVEM